MSNLTSSRRSSLSPSDRAAARAGRAADRAASQARILAARAAVLAAVAGRSCPLCGQAIRRNLAIAGWWQCSGVGAEGFRAAGSTPCSWQGFTE